MTERSRTRVFFTVSVPESSGAGVIESLASLGVGESPPAMRAALDGLSAWAASPGTAEPPAGSEALRSALASVGAPAAVSYRVAAARPWLSTLLLAAEDAGAGACTVVAWTTPCAIAAATSGPARALALASWETALHAALGACAGRACVILPPAGSLRRDAVLAQCVTGSLAPGPATRGAERPGGPQSFPMQPAEPTDVTVPGEHADVLPTQRALAHELVAIEGYHERLAAALPSTSAWTTALADADRRARAAAADAATAWEEVHARALDADVLWTALWRTSLELADTVDEALARDLRHGEEGDVARAGPGPLSSP